MDNIAGSSVSAGFPVLLRNIKSSRVHSKKRQLSNESIEDSDEELEPISGSSESATHSSRVYSGVDIIPRKRMVVPDSDSD